MGSDLAEKEPQLNRWRKILRGLYQSFGLKRQTKWVKKDLAGSIPIPSLDRHWDWVWKPDSSNSSQSISSSFSLPFIISIIIYAFYLALSLPHTFHLPQHLNRPNRHSQSFKPQTPITQCIQHRHTTLPSRLRRVRVWKPKPRKEKKTYIYIYLVLAKWVFEIRPKKWQPRLIGGQRRVGEVLW